MRDLVRFPEHTHGGSGSLMVDESQGSRVEAFVLKPVAEQSPSATGHTGLRRASGILPKTLSWRLVLRAAATGMNTLRGNEAQDVWEGAQRTGPQGSTGLVEGDVWSTLCPCCRHLCHS